MTEGVKTVAFVAVAAVALGAAYFTGIPATPKTITEAETGEFFPEWDDALAATSLEIVGYDEETGTPHRFKVMQVNDKWSIPSHENYPADAERQLAEAATSVMHLEKLGLVTTDKDDHELYGVIEPDPKTLKGGEQGVGKRVTLEDKDGDKLAHFIIGKAVEGQPDIHYVRVPGSDAVYRCEVKPDKLTTKFEDWIEKDLLKLNGFDIKQVVLNNYSIDEVNRRISQADVLELTYDNEKSSWALAQAKAGEELDNEKLNALKTALDDLKIVDVRAKPDGLSHDLKAEEGINLDAQAIQSLVSKGFIFVQGSLLSNEGEAIVRMKDGVTYVLRFGEIAADTGSPDDKKSADDETGEDDGPSGSNRYIFVTAQFDPTLIPQPELAALPGESPAEEEKKADEKTDEAAKADDASSDDVASDEADADAAKSDANASDEKSDADKKSDETSEDAKSEKDADAKSAEEKADEAAVLKREQDKKRREIEKENKRKQDEYDEKVKKGKERVKELNDRFADWYYVISDDVYRKIHLTRADIVKVDKNATPEANGLEALNTIKEEGLQQQQPQQPQSPQQPGGIE